MNKTFHSISYWRKKQSRLESLLAGRTGGGILQFPFVGDYSAAQSGLPIPTLLNDADLNFNHQMKIMEKYGFGWGPYFRYASYGIGCEDAGQELSCLEDHSEPYHNECLIRSEKAAEKFQLPSADNSMTIAVAKSFSRLQADHGLPVTVVLGGIVTLSARICPLDELCRWIILRPDVARKILQISADYTVEVVQLWVRLFGAEKVIPMIFESLTARPILSHTHFEKFIMPCLAETADRLLSMGIEHLFYHIGGDQGDKLSNWSEMPMGNPGICSIGCENDLEQAIACLGKKAIIVGNIHPQCILEGPKQRIRDCCLEILAKGKKAPRGFMLGTGWEILPSTPAANIGIMKEVLEEWVDY
jgi:uroporphyrinogen-III decarboxylase